MIKIGKIYLRSNVGIITAGVVTILVGATMDPQIMAALYIAIGSYIYLDKDVSGEVE